MPQGGNREELGDALEQAEEERLRETHAVKNDKASGYSGLVPPRLAVFNPPGRRMDEAVARAVRAEELGYESVWVTQLPDSRDASLVLAAYGAATKRVGLGTGVLPIYTRHPTAMVQMAATLDEITGGRFILGIGVSHQVTVEGFWGLKLERPVEALREYLTIVRQSLLEGRASFEGEHFTARWVYSGPRRPQMRIMVAALGPRMLEMAGEHADGVVLWMCSPRYVESEVVPRVRAGRERAGKTMDGFEIVSAVSASLTSDPAAARDVFRKTVERYASLPFYRRIMDAGGFAEDLAADHVPDAMLDELAGIGDEAAVKAALARYRQAGVTLVAVGPFAGHEGAAGFEATLAAAIS